VDLVAIEPTTSSMPLLIFDWSEATRAWLYGKLLVTLLAKNGFASGAVFSLRLLTLGTEDRAVHRVNSLALHQIQQAVRAAALLPANALFVESDCTSLSGEVAQATTCERHASEFSSKVCKQPPRHICGMGEGS
jgi:hypothetical protein